MIRRDDRAPDELALTLDTIEAVVGDWCFPPGDDDAPGPGQVGLEIERFPIHPDVGRVQLDRGSPSSVAVLDHDFGPRTKVRGLPAYRLPSGGHLTFEPGGQIEHATAPSPTAAGALAECEEIGASLATAFDRTSCVLASSGIDLWHDLDSVEQQLSAYRYPAMEAYFRSRGHAGPLMMRHSCSLQVNLDLGRASERAERWLVGNLLAPILTATFANSPGEGVVSMRARAWQALDPTRTGFPVALVEGATDDPTAQMARAALEADVLLVRTGPESAEPGRPGWTFGEWVRDGHPDHGHPTTTDLGYHLSTLFLELRPRGKVEFRGIDALPFMWRAAPLVLLAGALEDPQARARLVDLLNPLRSRLPALWKEAATEGVAAPKLCAMAVEAWSYALEGATRLPAGYLSPAMLVQTEEFLERFTLRGRCPADDLRDHLARGRDAALASVAEPVPQHSGRLA